MTTTIKVKSLNDVHMIIGAEDGPAREIWEFFSFKVDNANFRQKKLKYKFDGYIRLFNFKTRTLYRGLLNHLKFFCQERNYHLDIDLDEKPNHVTILDVEEFFKTLDLPEKIELRDYQVEAVAHTANTKRCVLLSPTSSGKSLIIYALIRFLGLRTLLVVPSTNLVLQMRDDFQDYSQNNGWDVRKEVQIIMEGASRKIECDTVISTWQSLQTVDADWLDQFDFVIVDEAHHAKAKSFKVLLEKMTRCAYRLGTTGTLDGVEVNELIIAGLLGPVKKTISTREMIDSGYASNLMIQCFLLGYSKTTRDGLEKDYQKEIELLIGHERRNEFITKLAMSTKGNTLILFNRKESHGYILHDMLKAAGANVYYIDGDVEADDRNDIRKRVDNASEKCIILASVGTFSTGVNLPNLHNIIFASPSKSRIKVMQSIGRGLRKAALKHRCNLYDIADDLSKSKAKKNYTLVHFAERLKMYISEQFDYQITPFKLEK